MVQRHEQACPIAATLNVIGDHWSMLVLREAFFGRTRFGEFEKHTGIAKNILTQRLNALVDQGVLERSEIGQMGKRFAYVLTPKGEGLLPVLMAMADWGNAHVYGEGKEPAITIDKASGERVPALWPRMADGRVLSRKEMRTIDGPGRG